MGAEKNDQRPQGISEVGTRSKAMATGAGSFEKTRAAQGAQRFVDSRRPDLEMAGKSFSAPTLLARLD